MDDRWLTQRLDRRSLLRGAAGAALGAGLLGAAACGGGSPSGATSSRKVVAEPDGDLLLFNWAQYMNPDVIKGFEKRYGVKVRQTFFDNMDGMMAKLNAGVKFDVTFPENAYAAKLVQAGSLMELDHDQLRNWGEVEKDFLDPWYDPGARHSIPYAVWTTGIGWRADKVDGLAGSWDDLWSHPEASGKIWLLDDVREVLGMSLLRLGYDLNSTDGDEVQQAAAEVEKLMPDVRGFTSVNNQFVNGTSWMQHIWSGQVWQAILQVDNPEDYRFERPSEGTPLNSDTVVIPADAPHPGTALLFLDWILDPENAAANVSYIGYPQGTGAGLTAYNDIVKQYPFLEMDTAALSEGRRFEPLAPQDVATWNEAWLRVKAA